MKNNGAFRDAPCGPRTRVATSEDDERVSDAVLWVRGPAVGCGRPARGHARPRVSDGHEKLSMLRWDVRMHSSGRATRGTLHVERRSSPVSQDPCAGGPTPPD